MVQKEALRLFAEKGYAQTTVDDIAHAAAMSPRTFFRYFATKEDVVLWDEYDEFIPEIWRIPPGEDAIANLILVARVSLANVYQSDPEGLLARVKLSVEVPEVRARFLNLQVESTGQYLAVLANAMGVERDDMRMVVAVLSFYSAMIVAVERWQRHDGREDLLRLFDDAIATVADSADDLRKTVRVVAAKINDPASTDLSWITGAGEP